jgi:outer membrane receptor protein involved in Fe transport
MFRFAPVLLAPLAAPLMGQPLDLPEEGEAELQEQQPSGQAAAGPERRTGSGEAIIVTARLPEPLSAPSYASVEIPRQQIVNAPSGRIEEVLSLVAGFQQFRRSDSRSSNPSAQGVTLRALGGNATSRALVLLDGVPVADPFFGFIPFATLAPERIGSIVVTKGGGSGPYGSGALAGVIELESVSQRTAPPVLASGLVNDRGGTEAAMVGTARLGAGHGVVAARWDRGRGFFTTPEEDRVEATARAGFDARSLALNAEIPVGDSMFFAARAAAFDDQRTLRFEGADSRARGQDASIALTGFGAWAFEANAYIQARNFANEVISSTRFTRVLDQRNTPSLGIGGKFELRPPVGRDQVLRIGVDYRRAEGELQEDAYSAFSGALTERRRGGGVTEDAGAFAEYDRAFGRLVVTGGVRLDRTRIAEGFFERRAPAGTLREIDRFPSRTEWTATYRAGARYTLHEGLAIRAAAYSGLRLPTLNELYRPFVVFPVVTEANAELRNERLEGIEVGLDVEPFAGMEVALTAFDNRLEDAIANVTIGPNLRQRRNLPAIEARGVEASASLRRGGLSVLATASYTDAAIEGEGASFALDGNRPPQAPAFAAAAQATYEGAGGWSVTARAEHIGAQFESDQETDRLPPATTVGLAGSVPVAGPLHAVARVENLLNEEIVTRRVGDTIDLGAPRTFWFGLRYNH